MKVALVSLTGDVRVTQEKLATHYPGASIEIIPLTEMKTGGLLARLKALRKRQADVFAMGVDRLAWQRSKTLFMLFGALAGVREVLVIDDVGAVYKESRAKLLLTGPARITGDAIFSAIILARARKELAQLERSISDSAVATRVKRLAETPATRALEEALPTRVVYLRATPGTGTQAGGALSHIKGVIDGLSELGAEVRLISNAVLNGFDETKLPITIIGPESVGVTRAIVDIHNNTVFSRGAVSSIEKDPPELIYQRYSRFGWAGVRASLRSRRPLFLEYNGSEVWVGKHWDNAGLLKLLGRYERLNIRGAARIFVVSDVERRNLERAGVPPEKIIVNPNGVDTERFRPGIGGARVRRELGVDDGELLVGFLATFGPWHGVMELAEAIKQVPAQSRVRFLLVGKGALLGEMKSALQAEEKAGRVIFTGAVTHDEVPDLLDACDLFVSPHVPLADGSEFFGSPTKIFEYMAMGKGIVASNLGQIGDVLTHEETALLVEPGNPAQIAAAIMRLAESPELRERLGAAARSAAIERHTWRRNAQNVLDAYDAWLKESD